MFFWHSSSQFECGCCGCFREGLSDGGGGGRDLWNALVMGSQGTLRDVLMKTMISWSRLDICFARPPRSFRKVMMSKTGISWLLVGLL